MLMVLILKIIPPGSLNYNIRYYVGIHSTMWYAGWMRGEPSESYPLGSVKQKNSHHMVLVQKSALGTYE